MNVRELIDALLKHDQSPTTEVCIETKGGQVSVWDVNVRRKGGYTVLSIEPNDDLMTVEVAEELLAAKEQRS